MGAFANDDERPPFFIPFLLALLFGVPVAIIWYLAAMKVGLVATIITILLGCACGFGARISANGWHPAGAAIVATLILIISSIVVTTIGSIALESEQPFLVILLTVLTEGMFVELANDCLSVAGKTFIGYPLGLYAAYRVSDAS